MVAQVRLIVIDRHNWMTAEEFSDALAIATMLPGPVAVNLVSWCGFRLHGWLGAFTAMFAVLWPAVSIMCFLTLGYSNLKEIVFFNPILKFIEVVIASMIISSAIRLISSAEKKYPDRSFGLIRWFYFIMAFVVSLFFSNYYILLTVMIFSAFSGIFLGRMDFLESGGSRESIGLKSESVSYSWIFAFVLLVTLILGFMVPRTGMIWLDVYLDFSKISISLFGGGYAVVPLLKSILIDGSSLLKESDLYVGITFGQMTPGPILISSVFYGFLISGWLGSIFAILGMFLPSAFLMIFVLNFSDRWRSNSKDWKNAFYLLAPCVAGLVFLSGINVVISQHAGWSFWHFGLLLVSFYLIHLSKIQPVWIIGLAILLGLLPL